MTQAVKVQAGDQSPEFVVINKGVKSLRLNLAKALKTVPLPPLAGGGDVFGQEYEVFDKFSSINLQKPSNNLFINSLHYAFCHHLPIMIRPDDLWLQILQGIAIHVSQNKDKLQTSIVNFAHSNSKIQITVVNDNLQASNKKRALKSNNINWKSVFEQFTQQCEKICAKNGNTGKLDESKNDAYVRNNSEKEKEKEEEKGSIIDWGLCDFSTSSEICKVASQCSLFSVLSNYVSFCTRTNSGIPKIVLKGTVDDWKLLAKKCDNLKGLQCDFWYPHLTKVILNIVKTVELLNKGCELDETLKAFWKSIYHHDHRSGGDTVTGWCNAFIPYIFTRDKYSENRSVGDGTGGKLCWGTHPWDFPSSYTKAPMTWLYYDTKIECDMVGGIVGIQQRQSDGMVAPIVGWIVKKSCQLTVVQTVAIADSDTKDNDQNSHSNILCCPCL